MYSVLNVAICCYASDTPLLQIPVCKKAEGEDWQEKNKIKEV